MPGEAAPAEGAPPADAAAAPDAAVQAQAADAAAQTAAATATEAPRAPKARDLAELQKAQFEAREARRAARREVTELTSKLQAEAIAREAQGKRIAELEQLIARVKGGEALMVAAEQGADPAKAIEGYVAKSTPEQQIDAVRRELAAEREARQREEKVRAEERQRAEQQALVAAERAAVVSFARAITAPDVAKSYPHVVAEFEPEEIAQKAHEIQQWAKTVEWEDEHGKRHVGASYTFEAVAQVLERQAKAIHDRRTARRFSLMPAPATEQASGVGHRDQNGQASAVAQPTRSGPSVAKVRPSGTRKLTRDEEEAIDLAALRTAMAKDAAARGSPKH